MSITWTNAGGVGMRSTSKRSDFLASTANSSNPSSWNYQVSKDFLKSSFYGKIGPSSSFHPSVLTREVHFNDFAKVKQMLNGGSSGVSNPEMPRCESIGPGTYDIEPSFSYLKSNKPSTVKQTIGVQSKGASFIPKSSTPGPGRYEIGSGNEKKESTWSWEFMSNTRRDAFKIRKLTDIHAPFSKGLGSQKKSFLKNPTQGWV